MILCVTKLEASYLKNNYLKIWFDLSDWHMF